VERAPGERRGEPLAPPQPDRRPAQERERHVAAEERADLQQVGAAEQRVLAVVPQPRAGDQRGGGVGAAARHPARDRDRLADPQRDLRLDAQALGHQAGRPHGEVVAVERDAVDGHGRSRRRLDGHRQPPGGDGRHLVEEGDGMEDVDEVVIPVVAKWPHAELEVDLRRHAYGHCGHVTEA
jgi:hypothetical protein